jgi:hypothetical protein
MVRGTRRVLREPSERDFVVDLVVVPAAAPGGGHCDPLTDPARESCHPGMVPGSIHNPPRSCRSSNRATPDSLVARSAGEQALPFIQFGQQSPSLRHSEPNRGHVLGPRCLDDGDCRFDQSILPGEPPGLDLSGGSSLAHCQNFCRPIFFLVKNRGEWRTISEAEETVRRSQRSVGWFRTFGSNR